MSETMQIAIIVGVFSLLSAILVAGLNYFLRQRERKFDNDRQDIVAERLIARQDKLTAATDETARLLAVNTASSASRDAETAGKMERIHTLVNSDKTASLVREHAMLLEIITLHKSRATPESLSKVDIYERQVAELDIVIAERLKQTETADRQAERTEHPSS